MPCAESKINQPANPAKDLLIKTSTSMRRHSNDSIYRSRSNSASGIGIADSEHSAEGYLIRSKKAAGYLRQILHTQKCGGMCQNASCIQTTRILSHVLQCDVAICSHQGCETTKKLLGHFQQCRFGTSLRGGLSSSSSSSINGGTCLVCSMACSSSPTKALMPQYNLHAEELMREEEETEDTSFSSDEVIEFNRIPFQNNQHEARPKTLSEGCFAVPTGAPRAKARSKSMNAMSVDEFSAI